MDETKFVAKSRTVIAALLTAGLLVAHLTGHVPAWLSQSNADLIMAALAAVAAAYFRVGATAKLSMTPVDPAP